MQTLTTSESLLTLPADWILEPVIGKRPYRKNWTKTNIDRLAILAEIESGKATGLGLKLGNNGLLAIDIDGESAAKLLAKLAGTNSLADLATTTAWTSGRPGRKQYLLSVPKAEEPRVRNLRIGTGVFGDDGKEECLEFRWFGTQSVLPPSSHPSGKIYTWIKDPLQNPPLPAPEWLIDLCENWHSEYVGDGELDLVRFPVRLLERFRSQMKVWLLARRFDTSRWTNNGKPKGSGIGTFRLTGASKILNRSKSNIRKLLGDAKKSGLIHNYLQKGEQITVFYTSLEKAIAIAGVKKLGPVAAVNIDDLANIHIIATEVEAQHLQRASFYRQRQEEMQQIKAQGSGLEQQPTQIIEPSALHTSDKPAGVITKSARFIFCESGFRFYGGSQEAIALLRGISPSTVSRHLSNDYRLAASPVQGLREELPPIIKKQLVEKQPHLKQMPPKLCLSEGLFSMHGDWWKPHCNVYHLNHRLVSARRRRGRIEAAIDKRNDKQDLCLKSSATQISEDKFLLSVSSVSKEIEEIEEIKKWGKTYYFGSVPNWNTGELNLKRREPKSRLKNRDKEKQK